MPVDLDKLKERIKAFPAEKQKLALDTAAKINAGGGAGPAATPAPAATPTSAPASLPRRMLGAVQRAPQQFAAGASGAAEEAGRQVAGPTGAKVAGAITRTVFPPDYNWAQVAIDAAMFGLGREMKLAGKAIEFLPEIIKPAARLAARVGKVAGAGAVGGAVEGEPGAGAIKGAKQAAGGEVLAGVTRTGAKTLAAFDTKALGGFLQQKFPALGRVATVQDFDRLFRGGQSVDRAGKAIGEFYDTMDKQLEGHAFQIKVKGGPTGEQTITTDFKTALDKIRELEDVGFSLQSGEPNQRLIGRQMRQMAHDGVQDIAKELGTVDPKLGKRFLDLRTQYSGAKTLNKLFNEPGAIDAAGHLNMPKVQELLQQGGTAGYRGDFERILGPEATDELLNKARAGSTARDVPGSALNLRAFARPGAEPGFSVHPGSLPKHVGEVPPSLGRGRALAAAITLGPARIMHFLNEALSGFDTGDAAQPVPAPTPSPSPAPVAASATR